jgi:predicted amidophosphoribosyltransferase
MALQPCAECGAQISDNAAACPQCGSPPTKHSNVLRWLGAIAFVFVGLFVLGLVVGSSPEAEARMKDERAIELCWNEQKRPSLEPEEARFVAAACEKMEADYRVKHGRNP